ncbi:hypothetical protein IAT40_005098 [Kwoniella sp. CBS 6097]
MPETDKDVLVNPELYDETYGYLYKTKEHGRTRSQMNRAITQHRKGRSSSGTGGRRTSFANQSDTDGPVTPLVRWTSEEVTEEPQELSGSDQDAEDGLMVESWGSLVNTTQDKPFNPLTSLVMTCVQESDLPSGNFDPQHSSQLVAHRPKILASGGSNRLSSNNPWRGQILESDAQIST